MKHKIGVKEAVEFLKHRYPTSFVPDDIHRCIGATIKADTLAHSLRRVRRTGEVNVEYSLDRVAFYRHNPDYGKGITNNGAESPKNYNEDQDELATMDTL